MLRLFLFLCAAAAVAGQQGHGSAAETLTLSTDNEALTRKTIALEVEATETRVYTPEAPVGYSDLGWFVAPLDNKPEWLSARREGDNLVIDFVGEPEAASEAAEYVIFLSGNATESAVSNDGGTTWTPPSGPGNQGQAGGQGRRRLAEGDVADLYLQVEVLLFTSASSSDIMTGMQNDGFDFSHGSGGDGHFDVFPPAGEHAWDSITLSENATLYLNDSNCDPYCSLGNQGGTTLINEGATLRIGAGSSVHINGSFMGLGEIYLAAGSNMIFDSDSESEIFNEDGVSTFHGGLGINQGTLRFSSAVVAAEMNVSAGAVVEFDSKTACTFNGTVRNAGTMQLSRGEIRFNDGLLSEGPVTVDADGSLQLGAGESSFGRVAIGGEMRLDADAVAEFTGNASCSGVLNITMGGTAQIRDSMEVEEGGEFANDGRVQLPTGGSMEVRGAVSGEGDWEFGAGSEVQVDSDDAAAFAHVESNGTFAVAEDSVVTFDGLEQGAGGVVSNRGAVGFQGDAEVGGEGVQNEGTLAAVEGRVSFHGPVNSTGAMNCDGGAAMHFGAGSDGSSVSGAVTNDGLIAVEADGVLLVDDCVMGGEGWMNVSAGAWVEFSDADVVFGGTNSGSARRLEYSAGANGGFDNQGGVVVVGDESEVVFAGPFSQEGDTGVFEVGADSSVHFAGDDAHHVGGNFSMLDGAELRMPQGCGPVNFTGEFESFGFVDVGPGVTLSFDGPDASGHVGGEGMRCNGTLQVRGGAALEFTGPYEGEGGMLGVDADSDVTFNCSTAPSIIGGSFVEEEEEEDSRRLLLSLGDDTTYVTGEGGLYNEGSVVVESGDVVLGGTLEQPSGEFVVRDDSFVLFDHVGGQSNVSGSFVNDGETHFMSGQFVFEDGVDFSQTGEMGVGEDGHVMFEGGFLSFNGSVENEGTLAFGPGAHVEIVGEFEQSGDGTTETGAGSHLQFGGGGGGEQEVGGAGLFCNGSLLMQSGRVEFSGPLRSEGNFSVGPMAAVEFNGEGDDVFFCGGDGLFNEGNVTVGGGELFFDAPLRGPGKVEVEEGGEVTFDTGAETSYIGEQASDARRRLLLSSGGGSGEGGMQNNGGEVTFESGDAVVYGDYEQGEGGHTQVGEGTEVNFNGGSGSEWTMGGEGLTNAGGRVNVTGGALEFSGPLSHSGGEFIVDAASSVVFSGEEQSSFEGGAGSRIRCEGAMEIQQGSPVEFGGGANAWVADLTSNGELVVGDGSQLNVTAWHQSSADADTRVNDGGALRGPHFNITGNLGGDQGFVVGNVSCFGSLQPGNSPGTTTVEGDLDLESGSTVEWEIAGLDSYDSIVVTGAMSISDECTAEITSEGYDFADYDGSTAFSLLTVESGEVSGAFASVTSDNAGMEYTFEGGSMEADGFTPEAGDDDDDDSTLSGGAWATWSTAALALVVAASGLLL